MGRASAGTLLNPFAASFWADPYSQYPTLLCEPPRLLPLIIPVVVVARYREVVEVLRDHARFSSTLPELDLLAKLDPFAGAQTALFSDPPAHTRLRRIIGSYFKPARIGSMAPHIQSVADQLLNRIEGNGEFDAVGDYAYALPTAVMAHMLGIPAEHQPMLRDWSDRVFSSIRERLTTVAAILADQLDNASSNGADWRSADSTIAALDACSPDSNVESSEALRNYFAEEISRRRVAPRDDLISVLLSARDEAGALNSDELLALTLLILFAGNETTTNLIANGLLALCRHPAAMSRLRRAGDAVMQHAVEEVLRYDSPVQMIRRSCTRDTNLGGTRVPAGAFVLVLLGAANRDPAQFYAADVFDVGRHPNDHVAFGDGVHACIGARLARLQGEIALRSVIERFSRLRLREPDAPLKYQGSLLSRGLSSLPMAIY